MKGQHSTVLSSEEMESSISFSSEILASNQPEVMSLQSKRPWWGQARLFQKPKKWRKVQMKNTQKTIASVKHQEAGTLPNNVGHHGLRPTVDQGSELKLL